MIDREKVIKGLECRLDINGSKYKHCLTCDYRHDIDHCQWACQTDGILEDALALLKAQEPIEANCEHQCNKCKFYEGVHNVRGHAPCSLWEISGVMWNDYCSRFNLWKEGEV